MVVPRSQPGLMTAVLVMATVIVASSLFTTVDTVMTHDIGFDCESHHDNSGKQRGLVALAVTATMKDGGFVRSRRMTIVLIDHFRLEN